MNSLNGFSLTIIGNGHVVDSDYYALRHKSEYKIKINNTRSTKCDAEVFVDGESVGTWRINPYGSTIIERPAGISRKFTFLEENSGEAARAGISSGSQDNGLVKVVFKPERKHHFYCERSPYIGINTVGSILRNASFNLKSNCLDDCDSYNEESYSMGTMQSMNSNYSSGATGLGDHSNQTFNTVTPIYNIDHENVTTINMRLVVDNHRCNCHQDFVSLKGSGANIRTREPPRINNV